jgi:uncharacterized hydrophobic protein (TIGR00271 family)
MSSYFIDHFKLLQEKEDRETVVANISKGILFRGTNLWILIFAIFVASLGLNVNSTAVIIGAMLISPLMGPIMGLGLGMGINDLVLLRRSLYNYLLASAVALGTSTIYFLFSPLSEVHSELLSRISPTIYDVLIALFGGLAGILATASKQKGNVLPGVAIATALMPPLCTAGFGLATLKWSFFFGALYLFIINTVFIALATLITIRLLKFSYKHLPNPKAEKRAKNIVLSIVTLTLIPSIYFGYDMIQQNDFNKKATRFIESEAVFPNDYLLKKVIDPKQRSILLIFGGKEITEDDITQLNGKLKNYTLENTILQVKQGFAYLNENKDNEQVTQLTDALAEKEKESLSINMKLDSIKSISVFNDQLIKEAKVMYPSLVSIAIAPIQSADIRPASGITYFVYMQFTKLPNTKEKKVLEKWLQVKLNKDVKLIATKQQRKFYLK